MAGKKGPKKFFLDTDWLRNVYEVKKLPIVEIARLIGYHPEYVKALVKSQGIPTRDARRGRKVPIRRAVFDLEYAAILYVDREWNCDQIGALLGVHGCTIRRRLRESGVKIRHHNDTKRGKKSRNRIELDPDAIRFLIDEYSKPFASVKSVADRMGISSGIILRTLIDNGVPRKPLSKSRNFNGENHPCWKPEISDHEREHRRDFNAQADWRLKVYKRDWFTCQCCGDRSGNNLNAHHIEPHYRNKDIRWEVSNGTTLCTSCHRAYHRKYRLKDVCRQTLFDFIADKTSGQLYASSERMGQGNKRGLRSGLSGECAARN